MAFNQGGNNLVYGFNNPLASLPNANVLSRRAPTSSDTAAIGTFWLYINPPSLPQLYLYTSSGVWTQVSLDNGDVVFDSLTVNGPTELNGTITFPLFTNRGALVTDGTGLISDASSTTAGYVLTANSSGAPSFQPAGGSSGMSWSNVTGTTQAMSGNTGYIANNAGLVTFTLPATATIGTIVGVQGSGAGGWTIAQNAGQIIHYGSQNSTTGVAGSLSSSLQYDNAALICTATNTDWAVLYGNIGNLTVL